jgi:hypothetical protein
MTYPAYVVADKLGAVYSRDYRDEPFTYESGSEFVTLHNASVKPEKRPLYGLFRLAPVATDQERAEAWSQAAANQNVAAMNARVYAMSETDRMAWYTENTVASFLDPDFEVST